MRPVVARHQAVVTQSSLRTRGVLEDLQRTATASAVSRHGSPRPSAPATRGLTIRVRDGRSRGPGPQGPSLRSPKRPEEAREEEAGGGRGGGIRTHDLVLPKHARCQATLRPVRSNVNIACYSGHHRPAPTPSGCCGQKPTLHRSQRTCCAYRTCLATEGRGQERTIARSIAVPVRSSERALRNRPSAPGPGTARGTGCSEIRDSAGTRLPRRGSRVL
jgi:hypothetical protein